MAENINVTLQKLANNSAKAIQDSVNKANKQGLEFNAKEAEKARKFNAQEAATARAWQEKMSKSAHQMEVSDLRKAGLNPVLSANSGGAQSYTTSSASASNASGDVESGSNAYGSLFAGLMSNMAGLKQSEMSAMAQRYSADRSYHAAELSAMAQKYAADQSAAASRYVADRNYQAQMDKPQSNIVGLLDKYFGDKVKNTGAQKFYNNVKASINRFDNENLSGLKYGHFTLSSKKGNIDDCRSVLHKFGVELNSLNNKQRSRAARALYELQYSKTAPGAIQSLHNLKRK